MGAIFVSYARDDAAFIEPLVRLLEERGHSVWWDRHIEGGAEFSAAIEAALDEADIVMVAWSKASVKSRWVRDEAAIGGDSGRLLPLSLDGTRPPMGFRQFQTLELSGWRGSAPDSRTDALIQSVEKRLGGATGGPAHNRSAPAIEATPRSSAIRVAIGVIALLLIAAAAAFWMSSRSSPPSNSAKPTFALLPFTSTVADPALKSLASQARDSVAHTLADSGMSLSLMESALSKGSPADYLILGEFSASGEKFVATIRLEDARQRTTLWSRRFDIDRKSSADLPDRIGAQIAGSLSWAGALRMLKGKGAPDPALTSDLLRQMDLTGEPLEAYQISRRLTSKWPNSGMAQLALAMNTSFALNQIPRGERAAAVAAARRAATAAQKLIPDFGDAAITGCVLQPASRIGACEDILRAAARTDPDAPFVNFFLALLLSDVGRFEESFELARSSFVHDPYMPAKIALMTERLTASGQEQAADRLYRNSIAWWPESGILFSRLSGFAERGDWQAIPKLQAEIGPEFPEGYVAFARVAKALESRSLAGLKQACRSDDSLLKIQCMLAFAELDDPDSAYALASELYPGRVGRSPEDEERLWLETPSPLPLNLLTAPAAAKLRRDSRYLDLARRTGLLRYWRSGRLPDFCRKPEPVCGDLRAAR